MNELNFDIKRVQSRLLEMARNIANILEFHEIPYEIAFGTLLGAVRHRGFIPWDDDFDFFLFDDSYEKAMEVLAKELPSDMFLENEKSEPNFFHAWARIKDKNSNCSYEHYPQDSLYVHRGLCVDLFRIKKIRECDFADFRYEQAIAYIDRRKTLGLIDTEDYEKRRNASILRKEKDFRNSENEIFAYPFDIGIQYIEDVFPLKKYPFENTEFFGPQNAQHILQMRYGNYMELPKESDRRPHYGKVEFLS